MLVLGPTASGKTAAAIHLANAFGTEILSCDARQFYRQMSIGTAKPDATEMAAAPHHFIDTLNIDEHFNAGKFEVAAIPLISQLHEEHDHVILAGGSGLYAKAVTDGFDELPPKSEELRVEMEAQLSSNGLEFLQKRLLEIDPDNYPKIDNLNPRRLMRAIEVFTLTGKSFLSFHQKSKKQRAFRSIKVGLKWDRKVLYQRIDERVDRMMEAGLLAEVESLRPQAHLNALQTVGYRELFEYFDGKHSLKEAVELIKRNSRRYAKRQMTWFGKDEEIQWFEPGRFDEMKVFIENSKND